jgi:hypothetical protein
MLGTAAQALLNVIKMSSATESDIQAAAQALFRAASRASRTEAMQAMQVISPALSLPDATRAAFVATVCGAFVEHGLDPSAIVQPLVDRLRKILPLCVALADACRREVPDPIPENQSFDELFRAVRERLAPSMPEEAAAWEALEKFWPPAIAVFSASQAARALARDLRELAGKLSDVHTAGHWLRFMLFVLDNEPLLVIEPATELGILARMNGVVDNFQLQVFLMDIFPQKGWFKRRRVASHIVDIARGNGPQRSESFATGCWNLYSWQAVRPDLTLPDPMDYGKAWIWGEGIPDDIPRFENRRVVLLGPASYQRSWPAQRLFDHLRASMEIEQKLSKAEVREWLQKLATAPRAG